ncbi:hypothetical protein ACFE04_008638 [Oxalis oulophora]
MKRDEKEKLDLINRAIQNLIEEKRKRQENDDDDDHLLLSKLLSQLESLECNDPMLVANEAPQYVTCPIDGTRTSTSSRDEIVEELKKMERQNSITHFLLSAVILLNIVWQLSEVSLILKIKHALTNPFKWVGNIIAQKIVGRQTKNGNSSLQQQLLSPALQLPHVDLPVLNSKTAE